jgi:hypothetical protein
VDPRDVFPHPVSKGVVEMVSFLFTQMRGIGILRSSPFGDSPKFVLDLLLRNGCRNARETVLL